MIVVDSSVWIGQFRGATTPAVNRLTQKIDENEIVVGDLVLLEVLQGAHDDTHAIHLERRLRKFTVEQMLDHSIAVRAAKNYRVLRGRGITVRKTVDLIIATFCVERGYSLLHDDRDFDALAPHLGLTLV
jgi:predicted nucleic acid-binding protein